MAIKDEKLRTLTVQIDKDLWTYLRMVSFKEDKTMASIVRQCLERYRKNRESKSNKIAPEE